MGESLRALVFDGGGVKGATEACIVDRLEGSHQLLSKVDVFAGTSTGGIIALALAAGVPVSEVVDIYRLQAARIFASRDLADKLSGGLDEYVRANYGQEGLRAALEEVFGTRRLPQLSREVLVPAFDLMRNRPKFFDRTDDYSLVDVALATSAAPTYLPGHIVHERATAGGSRETQSGAVRCFIDGGVFANNPSDRVIHFVRNKLGHHGRLVMLSVGAGATPYRPPEELLYDKSKTLDWGYRQWVVKAPHPLFKVLFDGSVVAAHAACEWELKRDYHRVQVTLPEDVDLADASKVPLLLALAAGLDLQQTERWLELVWEADDA